jgi:hypothetical protein
MQAETFLLAGEKRKCSISSKLSEVTRTMLDNETGIFLECGLERKERSGDDLWLLCITASMLWGNGG